MSLSTLSIGICAFLLWCAAMASGRARAGLAGVAVLVSLAWFPLNATRDGFAYTSAAVIVLVLIAVALLASRPARFIPLSFIPAGLYLMVMLLVYWPHERPNVATSLNLLMAIVAWAVGAYVAGCMNVDRGAVVRMLALCLCALVIVEFVVTGLQALGVGIFPMQGRTLDLEGGRANGTYWHPSVVGKILLLVYPLLLVFSISRDRVVRWSGLIAVYLSLGVVAFSESRANILALLMALVIWTVTRRRGGVISRVIPLGIMVTAGIVGIRIVLDRFAADPEGGARGELTETALRVIQEHPWFGVGPGEYLSAAAVFDPLAAAGWPVHNVFLLQTAELGVIGAALYFAPLLVTIGRSVPALWVRGDGSDLEIARALASTVPGLLLIGLTGWGLAIPPTHWLWFFVFGLCSQQMMSAKYSNNSEGLQDSVAGRARLFVKKPYMHSGRTRVIG